MKLYILCLLILSLNHVCSKSDLSIGYTFTLAVPVDYTNGFSGKAYIMETDQMPLNFRTALSVDAIDGRYACSLQIFLGNVKVWSSGHQSMFFTSETCLLELTTMGDLRLKGPNEVIGWKTGTSGQGVEKLQLLESGNMVLVDAQESIKWQTFNFPTNVLLEGQRLSVATHLTSFHTNNNNSNSFFSFEIHHDKVALYLNPGGIKDKYSYWEFEPPGSRNITFIELSTRGLDMFNDIFQNFSQIHSLRSDPVRFLSLDNSTGNLGLYYYSPYTDKFEVSFQALNSTCDLPLACSPYGICTFSKSCSCVMRLLKRELDHENSDTDCSEEITSGFLCGKSEAEMLELEDAGTLLKTDTSMPNISKRECVNSCLNDCKCAAAMYTSKVRECMFYGVVRGVKQVNRGSGLSYLVKVTKGVSNGNHKKTGLQKWQLILIVVADGLILLLVMGGLGYFMVWKRRKRLLDDNSS